MSWELLGPAATHPDPNKIRGGRPEITADDVRLALGGLSKRPFLFGMAAFLGHRGSMEDVQVLLEHDLMEAAEYRKWGAGRDSKGRSTGELTRDDIHILERMARLMLFEVISARSRHDTYAHETPLPGGSSAVRCPACNGRGDRPRSASDEELGDLQLALDEAERMSLDAVRRALPPPRQRLLQVVHHEARRALTVAKAWPVSDECYLCHGKGRFLLTERRRALMVGVSRPTWYQRWLPRYAVALSFPQRWEAIAQRHVRNKLRGEY